MVGDLEHRALTAATAVAAAHGLTGIESEVVSSGSNVLVRVRPNAPPRTTKDSRSPTPEPPNLTPSTKPGSSSETSRSPPS